MITAILTTLVSLCLFYGKIPLAALVPLSLGLGAALGFPGGHRSTQLLTLDVLAQVSRLNKINADLKFWTALVLMALCISSKNTFTGLFLTMTVPLFVVYMGGIKLRDYIRILALPTSFLLLSGLTLLIEVTNQNTGVVGIPIMGHWLTISAVSQARSALVLSRALGAVSCLYLISLTTPMSELISVLRRVHCPNVLIELMYLIYRYIFILLSMYHTMTASARSRLGYASYRVSIRTTAGLYSNLLERSYRQAGKNFDAMESRCYQTKIQFLESRVRTETGHFIFAIVFVIITLILSLLPSGGGCGYERAIAAGAYKLQL